MTFYRHCQASPDNNFENYLEKVRFRFTRNIAISLSVLFGINTLIYYYNEVALRCHPYLHKYNMNGLETAEYVRKVLKSDVLIIAHTASILHLGKEQYKNAGMDDFILKPFNVEDVINVIAHHLNLPLQYKNES